VSGPTRNPPAGASDGLEPVAPPTINPCLRVAVRRTAVAPDTKDATMNHVINRSGYLYAIRRLAEHGLTDAAGRLDFGDGPRKALEAVLAVVPDNCDDEDGYARSDAHALLVAAAVLVDAADARCVELTNSPGALSTRVDWHDLHDVVDGPDSSDGGEE
jgi:hypothetical protein